MTTKEEITKILMKSQPHSDPNKRYTLTDVKCALYKLISDSNGKIEFDDLPDDSLKRVKHILKRKIKKSIRRFDSDGDLWGAIFAWISDNCDDSVDYSKLDKEMENLIPSSVREYVESNINATYTNLMNQEHFDNVFSLINSQSECNITNFILYEE